jgi:FdhE protein
VNSPGVSSTQSSLALAFHRRAERAEALAPTSEAAASALHFAAGLFRAQASNAVALASIHPSQPFSGDLVRDVHSLLAPAQITLRFVAENGPPALAQEAKRRGQEAESVAASRLQVCWTGDRPFSEDYLSRALLRVYVEHLASVKIPPLRPHPQGYCPYCGGPPWIASRRAADSSEGAQRFLGCALCGSEWPLVRIRCPSCGEANPDKLPHFGADRYPAVRIEACDTCKRYVKSLDLTLDARPIPEVDELLSLGLDLWAAEQGYSRIEPGLAGI